MIIVGLAAVVGWKAHHKVPWVFFLWGALGWMVGVTLKVIAAIPNETIIHSVRDTLPRWFSEPVLWIYIGLLTGVFESGAVLGFAFLRRMRTAGWKESVGFGLGFGAIEALWVGIIALVLVLLYILVPERLPSELSQAATFYGVYRDSPFWVIPAPIIQRITAILVHAFSSLLIIYAVQRKIWRWFWLSFLYKTTVDAIAGFIHLTYGFENITPLGIWVIEFVFLPFGILGAWGVWIFRPKWQEAA
jgi:uncharacterized membrane protein YhfC